MTVGATAVGTTIVGVATVGVAAGADTLQDHKSKSKIANSNSSAPIGLYNAQKRPPDLLS